MQEGLLGLATVLPAHAAVDDHHRVRPAEEGADTTLQVGEGVPVLGEQDQLLAREGVVGRDVATAPAGGLGLRHSAAQSRGREDLPQQVGQLPPLGVVLAPADLSSHPFQVLQRGDLGAQLGHGAGRRRLIEHLGLCGLDLVVRSLVEVLHVFDVQRRSRVRHGLRPDATAALQAGQLFQAALQALAPPPQGLVDRLRRGGEAALQDGQGEADGAHPPVVLERLGPVELAPHVLRDRLVETGLGRGELVRDRMGDALREQGPAVELEQVLLHHAPHQVGDVRLVHAVSETALEAVAVQQGQEELEVLLLAVVRRRRHQQEVAGEAGQQPAELVALGVAHLAAEEGGRHLVGLVADHQVVAAIPGAQLGLDLLVAGQLVQPRDGQVVFQEPVAAARRLQLVVGQDVERQIEAAVQLVLPLLDQAAGADDQAALQIAARDQLLDQQAGHDRLAGAGVIGQQEAQRLARQHGLVHSSDLVRQGVHQGGVDGQNRIEEVGQADAVGLGDQTVRGAIAVEAPGAALLHHLQALLVVAVEDLLGDAARRRPIDHGQRLAAVPLHADDLDRTVREQAAHGGAGLEVFEPQEATTNRPGGVWATGSSSVRGKLGPPLVNWSGRSSSSAVWT